MLKTNKLYLKFQGLIGLNLFDIFIIIELKIKLINIHRYYQYYVNALQIILKFILN